VQGCFVRGLLLIASSMQATATATDTAFADAEAHLRTLLTEDGVHVLHFWAPWCDNSMRELDTAWPDLVARYPDVRFTFVTVWDDGRSARETMRAHGLPETIGEVTIPDPGPSEVKENRRREVLGLPLTWIPSTWIFHKNGQLAFALNYGEMDAGTLGTLLEATWRAW